MMSWNGGVGAGSHENRPSLSVFADPVSPGIEIVAPATGFPVVSFTTRPWNRGAFCAKVGVAERSVQRIAECSLNPDINV
jgi:hypothetical protein